MNTRALGLFIAGLLLAARPGWALPSRVTVQKTGSVWKLSVNGSPFFVKGVGCNTAQGANGEDYLAMAAGLGANSVRTWGITPPSYFDSAENNHLMVDAGVWFNPVRGSMADSYQDPAYLARLKTETLAYVKKMKGHPALLMWNFGNEVFNFTPNDTEKKAFALFLEDLIQAVHKEDPNHPVVYACTSSIDLTYLKAYVPSIDIVGINGYGAYTWVLHWLEREGFDRPVIATEFGPYGDWDRMKDANHQPFDPGDHDKAKNYEDMWRSIAGTPERSLGGYAFVLGDCRNQASLTWFNINLGAGKRDAYWTLYALYTGQEPPRHAPRIRLLRMDRVSRLKPGEFIPLSVNAFSPDGDALSYRYYVTDIADDPVIVDPARYYPCEPQTSTPGEARVRVPFDPGVYRVYVEVSDKHGDVAIANRSIKVEPLAQ